MSTGKYIVVFKENVTTEEISKYAKEVEESGGEIKERYDQGAGILNGFAATIPDSFLQNFKNLQGSVIDYIEADQVVTTQ